MMNFSGIGAVFTLLFYALTLYIAYLVITVAVRHGIDNSELAKMLKQKYSYQDKTTEKFHPNDDLDKG